MKFPLRLSLDLLRARLSRPFAKGERGEMIFHLPAAMLPALHENQADEAVDPAGHCAVESVRAAAKTRAPVLWIGGSEPLEHAEVGRVAFALNGKGRNVFIHTDGQRLRQRIHEFRPDSRLFLTVELAGREEIHDRAFGPAGAFRRAVEGIRAAKLSGFYVCAHLTVNEQTEPCDAGELFEYLDRYDVDGFIVSSGGQTHASDSVELARLQEVRSLVRCSRWENFSRLLEASFAVRGERAPVPVAPMAPVASVTSAEAGAVEENA